MGDFDDRCPYCLDLGKYGGRLVWVGRTALMCRWCGTRWVRVERWRKAPKQGA